MDQHNRELSATTALVAKALNQSCWPLATLSKDDSGHDQRLIDAVITVDGEGIVKGVQLEPPISDAPKLNMCVLDTLTKAKFPVFKATQKLRIPYTLRSAMRPEVSPSQLHAVVVHAVTREAAPAIKRVCWQPALDRRRPDDPTEARLEVVIALQSDGTVKHVDVTPSPREYPGLSRCIAAALGAFTFPASSLGEEFRVPLVLEAH